MKTWVLCVAIGNERQRFGQYKGSFVYGEAWFPKDNIKSRIKGTAWMEVKGSKRKFSNIDPNTKRKDECQ